MTLDLKKIAESYKAKIEERRVIVCAGTACVANGALKVIDALKKEIEKAGISVRVDVHEENKNKKDLYLSKSGCHGFCQQGPLVTIMPENIFYVKVKPEDAAEIVETTLKNHQVVDRLLFVEPSDGKHAKNHNEITFYKRQNRVSLKESGHICPEDIEEYISEGGYEGAKKALTSMTSDEVCKLMLDSGLRGRGGAGFPTGKKWQFTLVNKSDVKYVVCNADEGDPGAFMDRSVMEGNPHSVLEGMLIAAKAIEGTKGYIYCRAEYPLAVKRVKKAIEDARSLGVLGKNIFGTDFSFDIEVMEGAGAFVCGEETALIHSIEGQRGMPTPKPPFPAKSGLFGKPTVINNVETLACVPLIMRNGAEWFKKLGSASSAGTKTFALTGHVANTGLVEVPFGTTLREIIFNIGGGVTDDQGKPMPDGFKAVQIGGPSGACLTPEHLDIPIDFDSVKAYGAIVGSGGLVVMNKNTCMVSVARFFMRFTQSESCGKCVLCREGTKQMLAMLDDIMNGDANEETLVKLEELAHAVSQGSLCGLGKTAPNPVLSTLKYFRDEYEAHVFNKKCPAKQCKALCAPEIDPAKCKGCTLCAKKCPVGAIEGAPGKVHKIDPEKCIKCGVCKETCKFGAVI
ncbi:MAG: NADH-quinone oxidoreductase subunit NuoF [Candidatus Riflebacteria bacterium]|nr:NADH-quinone oxidoreductase subunit NuoF [Candidatus Riflebacteria bacterium]